MLRSTCCSVTKATGYRSVPVEKTDLGYIVVRDEIMIRLQCLGRYIASLPLSDNLDRPSREHMSSGAGSSGERLEGVMLFEQPFARVSELLSSHSKRSSTSVIIGAI